MLDSQYRSIVQLFPERLGNKLKQVQISGVDTESLIREFYDDLNRNIDFWKIQIISQAAARKARVLKKERLGRDSGLPSAGHNNHIEGGVFDAC